ncbi:VOC family protein [Nocardioides sp. SYSU DS0651]|uniref:VOC family protein n=1 Tax=Nocardioides sp. SYSU DS0651 TaxID=3415955 RepID=UPI003F4C975F
MITNISITSVFVKDVDASKRFYVDVLGFQEKDDISLGDGYRWCTVVHPSQPELQVNLTVPGPPHSPQMVEAINRALDEGGMHGLGLNVDDCRKTCEELRAQGVQFVQEPAERPYGVEAVVRDNSGNWMVLVEPREYSAADFD